MADTTIVVLADLVAQAEAERAAYLKKVAARRATSAYVPEELVAMTTIKLNHLVRWLRAHERTAP